MECAPENEFAAGGPNEQNSLGQVAATLAIESETAGTVNDVGLGCSGGLLHRFNFGDDAGCFPPMIRTTIQICDTTVRIQRYHCGNSMEA
jgi:hypothetical protein